MTWILEERDKTGRKIHLSQERWVHIQKHPETTVLYLERVKEALMYPDKIVDFDLDMNVHFYFKYYKDRKEYLFISIKYLNGDGFIITSFYTDTIQ